MRKDFWHAQCVCDKHNRKQSGWFSRILSVRRESKFQKLISQVLRYEAEGEYLYSDFFRKKVLLNILATFCQELQKNWILFWLFRGQAGCSIKLIIYRTEKEQTCCLVASWMFCFLLKWTIFKILNEITVLGLLLHKILWFLPKGRGGNVDSAIDASSSRTCLSEPLRNESQDCASLKILEKHN